MKDKAALFKTQFQRIHVPHNFLQLPTPLGMLELDVELNSCKLSEIKPQTSGSVLANSFISVWKHEKFQIELLRVEMRPTLPQGMAVDHCFAFLWRIEAYAKAISPRFSCQLSVNSSAVEHNIELGEGLFSKSWGKQGMKLSLGTEDEDYLLQRAEAGHWLPTRFANEGHITFQQIISTERGIEVSLPNLREGEKAQIQFVIAWTRSAESTIANWFAVDVGASEILAQGCA